MRVTRPAPALHAMVDKARPAARWVLPLIALQMVWQAAPDDLRFIGSVRHLNGLLLIATRRPGSLVRAISGFAEGLLAQHPSDVADNLQARRILTQTRVLARTAISMVLVAGAAMMLMTFPGRAPGRRQPAGLGRRDRHRGRPGGQAGVQQPDRRACRSRWRSRSASTTCWWSKANGAASRRSPAPSSC